MSMKAIQTYKSKTDLRNKIVQQYIHFISSEVDTLKAILLDKNWASTETDYHNKCRRETKQEIQLLENQIKILTQ